MSYESKSTIGTGLIAFVGGMVAWAILGPKEALGEDTNSLALRRQP